MRIPSDTREVMTPKQAAGYLQLNVNTVYRWLAEGRMPGVKLPNNRWRILKPELDAWLSQGARLNLERGPAARGQEFLRRCDALREQILEDIGEPLPADLLSELIRDGTEQRVPPYDQRWGRRKP